MGRRALAALALAAPLSAQVSVTIPTFVSPTCREAFLAETAGLSLTRLSWIGAQIHVESAWIPDAVSPAGAVGLSQFMGWTWNAYSPRTEPSCAGVDRTDPNCSIRTQVVLMDENYARRHTFYPTDRMPAALSDYNGGPTALNNERGKCARVPGCNPNRYYDHVEKMKARTEAAWRENRDYIKRIERLRKNLYVPSR